AESAGSSGSAAAEARRAWPRPRTASSTRWGRESAGSHGSSRSAVRLPSRLATLTREPGCWAPAAMSRGSPEAVSRPIRVDRGSLQLDSKCVPLAHGLVVAGEGIGALVIEAHAFEGDAGEHAEPHQIQAEAHCDQRLPSSRLHMRPPLRRPVSPSHVAPQSPSVGSEKADGVPHAKAYVFADFARSRRWLIR